MNFFSSVFSPSFVKNRLDIVGRQFARKAWQRQFDFNFVPQRFGGKNQRRKRGSRTVPTGF
jgi:hypothetical protein